MDFNRMPPEQIRSLRPSVEEGAFTAGNVLRSWGSGRRANRARPAAGGRTRSPAPLRLVSLTALVLLSACAPALSTKKLTITGSSSVAPLAGELARRFEASHPHARVDVQTGGSSRGLADVRRGSADIGMVSRALHAEETDVRAISIALDGIALIVNSANPVNALSDEEIRGIFTGSIDNWSEVGGAGVPITVVNKAEGRSTLEVFLEHFQLSSQAIEAAVVIGDNQQGLRTVAGDTGAIAYVSIGAASTEIERGLPIRMLPLGGVTPSLANVREQRFPLARPLNLVTRHQTTSELADQFLRFAVSPQHDDLLARLSVVAPRR